MVLLKKRAQSIKKSTVWNMLKIVLAVVLIGFIVSQTSVDELSALWRRISAPWLLGSIVAFYALTWAMARRYWVLIGRKVAFHELLSLVIVQTIVSNFVASSAGAVSYVAILRSRHQIQIGRGVTSLVLARSGDLLMVLITLGVSSWFVWSDITPLHWLISLLIVSISGILLMFCFVVILRQRFVGTIERIFHLLNLNRITLLERMIKTMADLAEQAPGRLNESLVPLIIYSALVSAFMFAFFYCNTLLLAVPIGAWPILFILSLAQLMTIVPIQVFGGLGVYDITYLYLYSLFGIDQPQIAPVIIGTRIIFYAVNVLLLVYLPFNTRFYPGGSPH